jgi:hypothetical protein
VITKYGAPLKHRVLITICFAFILAVFAGDLNQLIAFIYGSHDRVPNDLNELNDPNVNHGLR